MGPGDDVVGMRIILESPYFSKRKIPREYAHTVFCSLLKNGDKLHCMGISSVLKNTQIIKNDIIGQSYYLKNSCSRSCI